MASVQWELSSRNEVVGGNKVVMFFVFCTRFSHVVAIIWVIIWVDFTPGRLVPGTR